jgi:hypothetical protein
MTLPHVWSVSSCCFSFKLEKALQKLSNTKYQMPSLPNNCQVECPNTISNPLPSKVSSIRIRIRVIRTKFTFGTGTDRMEISMFLT